MLKLTATGVGLSFLLYSVCIQYLGGSRGSYFIREWSRDRLISYHTIGPVFLWNRTRLF
jgi:hypothetical protein